jgi:4'-phosphopantetheinyl transferase
LIPSAGWVPAPASPALGADEAAVWRVPQGMPHPIEAVAARYLGAPVHVTRTPTGKPELEESDLTVSLAHSGEVVLVAVAIGGDVGVDVEFLRPEAAGWALVEQALTKRERRQLDALIASERAESFVRQWTRKEAILKAAGTGLSIDPRTVELDGLQVRAVPPELGRAPAWALNDVPLLGHAAAVARRGRVARLFLYDGRIGAAPAGYFSSGGTM